MRGSPCSSIALNTLAGIIPAHAGLTRTAIAASSSARDHPRACGAHFSHSVVAASTRGSSPRMRGSQKRLADGVEAAGIIPAHAGLTRINTSITPQRRDHPRACGAHRYCSPSARFVQGSSPRMRGSLRPTCHHSEVLGIIPAHAGLTQEDTDIQRLR